jgi:Coenzyme PQQ synthesis protein D (PqqD)
VDVKLESIYKPSDDVVARMIEGELIIVPLAAGVGDAEDELYTLNDTGRAIWDRLDGTSSLRDIVGGLESDFDADAGEVEKDVLGLIGELLKRRMVVESAA